MADVKPYYVLVCFSVECRIYSINFATSTALLGKAKAKASKQLFYSDQSMQNLLNQLFYKHSTVGESQSQDSLYSGGCLQNIFLQKIYCYCQQINFFVLPTSSFKLPGQALYSYSTLTSLCRIYSINFFTNTALLEKANTKSHCIQTVVYRIYFDRIYISAVCKFTFLSSPQLFYYDQSMENLLYQLLLCQFLL